MVSPSQSKTIKNGCFYGTDTSNPHFQSFNIVFFDEEMTFYGLSFPLMMVNGTFGRLNNTKIP